jgi:WD40 repeat protein
LLASVQAHARRVSAVAFSRGGALLASGGDDGAVRLWRTDAAARDALDDPVATSLITPHLTLLGLPEGWAAFSPDGRYKSGGAASGEFWHVVGLCRFEPGELDPYLPDVRRLPLDATF